MRGIIYKATNTLNNKVYVGQCYRSKDLISERLLTIRKNKHITEAKLYKRNFPFHNALCKYGGDSFQWDILLCCNSKKDLNYYETFYINLYNSLVDNKGYNCTTGGNKNKFSNRTRKAQSKSAKERWKREGSKITEAQLKGKDNPEYKKKASAHAKKFLHTPDAIFNNGMAIKKALNTKEYKQLRSKLTLEMWNNKTTKEKNSILKKGFHSKSSREKAQKSLLKYKKPVMWIDNKCKKDLGIFSSATDLAKHLNIKVGNIRAVLQTTNKKCSAFCKGKYTARFLTKAEAKLAGFSI